MIWWPIIVTLITLSLSGNHISCPTSTLLFSVNTNDEINLQHGKSLFFSFSINFCGNMCIQISECNNERERFCPVDFQCMLRLILESCLHKFCDALFGIFGTFMLKISIILHKFFLSDKLFQSVRVKADNYKHSKLSF